MDYAAQRPRDRGLRRAEPANQDAEPANQDTEPANQGAETANQGVEAANMIYCAAWASK